MTAQERERLLDLNERLCREYNETDDETILEQIAITEMIFLYGRPETRPESESQIVAERKSN